MLRHGSFLLLALLIAAGPSPAAQAAENDPSWASVASNLLQSRAQLRIFRHDDKADQTCKERAFTGAKVVSPPRVVDEAQNERKWLERWVLDRCGTKVFYHVFFTVVGEGGAFFVFQEILGRPAPKLVP